MIDIGALTGTGGFLAAVGSFVVVIYKTRGESKSRSADRKADLDKQIDERVASQLKDAWKRIKDLEEQVGTLTDDRDFQKSAVRTLGDGFDALSDYVERTTPAPEFTRREKQLIDDAKTLLADDALWNTSARLANQNPKLPKE